MTANYKQDENQLIKIVKEHVEPCDVNSRINLTIFYRARKLGQLFMRNKLYSVQIDTYCRPTPRSVPIHLPQRWM